MGRKESRMHQSVISVVIPAYNEEKTVGNVISDTMSVMGSLEMPYEILVVDDGSTDMTRQIATGYKAIVLSNGKNQGKGYALRKGFQHAQGDIVVTVDADGSHKPKEIPALIQPLFNGVDITAGSRFLGRRKDSTSRLNRVGNILFNIVIMILTGKLITDSQTGFRAFKKHALQGIEIQSNGYEIETELTVKGLKNGFVVQEVPICCEKRQIGRSRLRILFDGFRILRTILKANFSYKNHTTN
jgi:glycosyltransferase involved in cell wall biosynthesis